MTLLNNTSYMAARRPGKRLFIYFVLEGPIIRKKVFELFVQMKLYYSNKYFGSEYIYLTFFAKVWQATPFLGYRTIKHCSGGRYSGEQYSGGRYGGRYSGRRYRH